MCELSTPKRRKGSVGLKVYEVLTDNIRFISESEIVVTAQGLA